MPEICKVCEWSKENYKGEYKTKNFCSTPFADFKKEPGSCDLPIIYKRTINDITYTYKKHKEKRRENNSNHLTYIPGSKCTG